MVAQAFDQFDSLFNPLDAVEELVVANEWTFDRAGEDQLVVDIQGRWCDYRLFFMWHEENAGLQFACQADVKVPETTRAPTGDLLAAINRRLWAGHFDLCPRFGTPLFRYTLLLRGTPMVSMEQLEDLVELALSECERYVPAFQFVIWGGKSVDEAIEAAVLETVGEA